MELELTTRQFRRLLDMAYIGNWILNSTRGDDRFRDYDEVESLLFAKARELGMTALAEDWQGEVVPSRAWMVSTVMLTPENWEKAAVTRLSPPSISTRNR